MQKTLILRDPFTLLVFALALAGDQLSKALVRGALSIGESLPAEGFLRLTHVTNSGAIFGFFPNQAIVMTAASVLGIAVLLYFYHAHAGSDWRVRVSMGLLLGGAVGNLIDRLALGKVTDFLDVGAWPRVQPRRLLHRHGSGHAGRRLPLPELPRPASRAGAATARAHDVGGRRRRPRCPPPLDRRRAVPR